MRSAPIVEGQIAGQTAPRLRGTAIGLEVDFLIFNRPPEAFDHDIVAPRALANREQKYLLTASFRFPKPPLSATHRQPWAV